MTPKPTRANAKKYEQQSTTPRLRLAAQAMSRAMHGWPARRRRIAAGMGKAGA